MSSEDEAMDWIRSRPYVDAAGFARLEHLVAETRREAANQNLIAPSTLDHIWARHIQDSVQLAEFVPEPERSGRWLDIGTGAGFPGLVLGAIGLQVTCVEPRRTRAEHLRSVAREWVNVAVFAEHVEALPLSRFDVLTARALAKPARVIDMTLSLAGSSSIWILPAGRGAGAAVSKLKRDFCGVFHVEQSVTSGDAGIIVARGVKRRQT